MQRIHNSVRKGIFNILDIFYPMFRKFMPLQTYHYAACGGVNTLLTLATYFVAYNFLFHKEVFYIGTLALKPHIAALFVSFIVSLPVGFYLSMYVIFQGSYLKRQTQFFRYFTVILGCMIIDYIGLKVFVEIFHWYPTVSKLINTVIVILFNYFSQRHFSFKTARPSETVKG